MNDRWLVEFYHVPVPNTGRNDITERTEDNLHRSSHFRFQLQGDSLEEIQRAIAARIINIRKITD